MIDLNNIKNFATPRPVGGSIFGSLADFDALPETHKAQILFLDKKAEKLITYTDGYQQLAIYALIAGVVLIAISPIVRKLMQEVK